MAKAKTKTEIDLPYDIELKKFFAGPSRDSVSPKFEVFWVEFFAHGLLGLILGAAVDRLGGAIARYVLDKTSDHHFDERRGKVRNISWTGRIILFLLGTAQLAIDLFLLYALTLVLPTYVYSRWQGTIPGLAFSALFFGIQSNMFHNIRAIME